MKKILVQIYEIQSPQEAEAMAEIGVDHIGSVLLEPSRSKNPRLARTVEAAKENGAKSSLIPLFGDPDAVFRALDHYRPDIVHFCETLVDRCGTNTDIRDFKDLLLLQEKVKEKFPQIKIMRSIPIARPGLADRVPTMALAKFFEPVSDFLLTDTFLIEQQDSETSDQPVAGFVGITGKTCDWDMAAALVRESRIPVVLAGGISPENVAEGILKVAPAGIDSCTCTNAFDINGAPIRFKKDPERVRQMIESVRRLEKNI